MDFCRWMGWGWSDYWDWLNTVPAQVVEDAMLRRNKEAALSKEPR